MSAIANDGVRGWSRAVFGTRTTWFGLIFLAVWSIFIAGCGGDDSEAPPITTVDSGPDARDSGRDVLPDNRVDALAEASGEGSVGETGVSPDADSGLRPDGEAGPIVADADAAVDVRPDVAPDAPRDVVVDVAADRADVGPDVVADRGPDVIPDAPRDVVVEPPAVTLVSIAVSPTTPSIAKGTQKQFTATGTYSNNATADLTATVTWSSATTGVATINGAGLAQSPNNGSTGTSVITATSGTVSGSTTLTVTAAVLSSIAVTPTNPSVADGTTVQLTATGTYSDATTQNLTATATWASATIAVASVNGTGLATGQGQGTAVVSATVGAISGSTTVTVTTAVLVQISISPGSPSIAPTTSKQFQATGIYSNGTTQDLTQTATWLSSAPAVATVSDTAGTKGFAAGVATGTSTISATVGITTGSTILTVTNATLSSIAVAPGNPSIANGRSIQFTATGTFSDATTQDITKSVTWTSGDITNATIDNAFATKGIAKGVGVGSSLITATLGTAGSTTLNVTTAVLQSVVVTPSSPSIANGTQRQFAATGIYSDLTTLDLTGSVTWSSSAVGVATVANGGSAGLATGVGVGVTTITAQEPGGIAGTTTLTVTPETLQTISVSPTTPSIAKGTKKQFTATGHYTDSSTQDLTTVVAWDSSVQTVATISSSNPDDGLATSLTTGTTTISATYLGVTGSTNLTVTAAVLTSITVTPTNPSIAKGTPQPFVATGNFSDGSTQDLTATAAWASTNAAVATVGGSTGIATGVDVGVTTIRASSGAISGGTGLSVTAATLVSIAVSPPSPSIAKGTQQQFVATGTYTDTTTQDLSQSATWQTSDGTIASVTTNGIRGNATGLGVGTASISATFGIVTGSTVLTVTAATLSRVDVTPVNPSIAKGTSLQFHATGTYSDGTVQDLTATATWDSLTPATATIDNTGFATSLIVGTTTIRATSGVAVGTSTLTVSPATLTSITIGPVTPTIANGTTQQFTATAHYSDSTIQDLTQQLSWSSSSAAVGVVVPSGSASGLTTATGVGTTTISATNGTTTGSTVLTVTSATLDSITVAPDPVTIANGTKQLFVATGHYSNGSSQNLTTSVNWTSGTPATATIDNAAGHEGEASSVAPGTSTISATLSGKTGNASLTVTNATLTSIDVLPLNRNVLIGVKTQYSATGHFTSGPNQDLTTQVAWSSSNSAVALISNSTPKGEATAVGNGTSTITATLSAINGSTTLVVGP